VALLLANGGTVTLTRDDLVRVPPDVKIHRIADVNHGLTFRVTIATANKQVPSTKPHRVQLSRKKGFRLPANTISVARPGKWGNPHRVGYCSVCGVWHTREEAIAELRAEIEGNDIFQWRIRECLKGKNLACWCPLDQPCHADVLLEIANREGLA
jgi:hypothetical protein